MPLNLAHRVVTPELMDDPAITTDDLRQALVGLSRLNSISGAASAVLTPITRLSRTLGHRPLSVLDIATGAAEIPLALARHSARRGLALELHACDINPQAIQLAREAAAKQASRVPLAPTITLSVCDAIQESLPGEYDVVMTSLFLHHLSRTDAVRLLGAMSRCARHLVVVSDLVRSRIAYTAVWLGSRVVTKSPIVRTDALLSVRAAFTPSELLAVAQDAGMRDPAVERRFPARQLLLARGGAS